eukprot:m.146425 g.146425  ORF g.146425 m.146425 type:complete len:448 (-) comp52710_c0_seq1:41-1384(-)
MLVAAFLVALVAGAHGSSRYAHLRVPGASRAAVPATVCNVLDYGASGDGTTLDTLPIQAAIDDCATRGGGTVLLPSGYQFLSGSLFLSSNMSFFVSEGATLLGSTGWDDYPLNFYSRYAGTMGVGHASLINGAVCLEFINTTEPGDHCLQWTPLTNVFVEGGGVIDGQGAEWWAQCNPTCPDGSNDNQRPTLLGLLWIDGLTIQDLSLMNSPFWTTHPTFCNNVLIQNLNIQAPANSRNTDGIDPDSSSNVHVTDCIISTGDDCIAIKSGKDLDGRTVGIPANNVLIENMQFGSGHGISIGSEMSGNVTNVVFYNCTCNGTESGARVKTMRGRGGFVENVTYDSFTLFGVGEGISIDMQYQTAPPTNVSATPTFRNITISNFTATSLTGGYGLFICLPESPCHELQLVDVSLSGKSGYTCEYAYGTMTNVNPVACLLPESELPLGGA